MGVSNEIVKWVGKVSEIQKHQGMEQVHKLEPET